MRRLLSSLTRPLPRFDQWNGIVYYIGNVLSAGAMTRQNFGAGLYAPLRVAVYEDENGTTFEYDKPSTLFAQFHDPKIDEVAHSHDDRLAALWPLLHDRIRL